MKDAKPQDGAIVETAEIQSMATAEFVLEPAYELYLDSDMEAKAKVTFRKLR